MKFWFWSSVFLCVGVSASFGHEDHPFPVKITPAEQHRPSVLPDRIALSWNGNPAYSQNVTWRTSVDVAQGYVEYSVATGGPDFTKEVVRINAHPEPFESDLGKYQVHSAKMGALTPATRYVYRVGDGNNWSEWFQFRTASVESAPFTFIYFGDAQNDIRSMWSRIVREAHADAPRAAFTLHAGDLINDAEQDGQWGEWFGAGGWLNAMIPIVATPGNHEYLTTKNAEGVDERRLSKHWRPSFAFPENGPAGLEESVYWFDYQGVRIISLNSNEKLEIQAEWLQRVLDMKRPRWTIVTFHFPIYSSARGRDNAELRRLWKPILEQHEVDLVLQGHDHGYARSGLELPRNLETGLNVKDGPTVYVVSVSGPKQYDVEDRPFFKKIASGLQLYQVIHVEDHVLKYEARAANGTMVDGFQLIKRPGEFNELLEENGSEEK